MKKIIFIATFITGTCLSAQQVGINSAGNAPDISAGLDIAFSDKGVLVPRMDVTNRNNISSPANGLIIYNTDCGRLNYYDCDIWREVGESFQFPSFANPNNNIIINGSSSISQGQTGVPYLIPAINGAVSYTWTTSPGISIASGQGTNMVTADFNTSGIAYICVTATNNCGTQIQTCMNLNICPLPTVAPIAGNATPNQSQSGVTYSITPVTGANSYNWTVPAGATITAGQNTTSITVDFSPSAQSGDICVTATDNCGTSLPQCLTLTLGSCPVPDVPVATAETNLTLNDFDANWQVANGAVDYYLDVATDAGFSNFLPGYNNKNVGNNLTDNVTGLSCITDYYYRVKAENVCGTTISSNVIQVTINPLPSTPVATAGTNINATDFDANWNASTNATTYYIDVSDDAGFSNLILNNFNVGNVTTYNVSGLTCETDYYYRVRAENACGTTGNSNDITVTSGSCCVSGPGSVTFSYTGSQQQWTVPNLCNNTVTIEIWGADGGSSTSGATTMPGGKGGFASGDYAYTPGETLDIYVGEHGGNASGANTGGGGGGMSDIINMSNTVVIVAGGGGGGTCGSISESSTGGAGGGLTGGTAVDGSGVSGGTAATGGTQSAGGSATAGSYGAGSPGGFGYGGGSANGGVAGVRHGAGGSGGYGGVGGWNGGGGGCTSTGGNNHSAGGGSGYYGGGGGRGDGGAGGGGSSYIGGVANGVTIMDGDPNFVPNPDVSGNGYVRISW